MQEWLVGLIVAGCAVYALWAVLPRTWRRQLANTLAQGPWPAPVRRALQRAGEASGCGGGGCKGCGAGDTPPGVPPKAQPVHFHPRPPSR